MNTKFNHHNEFSLSKEKRLCYGQRHQIYVQSPKLGSGKGTIENKMLAYHHQWLYGRGPLRMIKKMIQFCDADNKYKWNACMNDLTINQFKQVVEAVLQIDLHLGTFHWLHDEMEALADDFTEGDNNDGITIIKIPNKGEKLKYCFMSFCGVEGEFRERLEDFVPYSASEYLQAYYKIDDYDNFSHAVVKYINNNAEVLTLAEVKKMFPQVTFPN